MMAYRDWSREEVAAEIRDDHATGTRRGVKHIWESIERDIEEQEALQSRGGTERQRVIVHETKKKGALGYTDNKAVRRTVCRLETDISSVKRHCAVAVAWDPARSKVTGPLRTLAPPDALHARTKRSWFVPFCA